MAASWGTAWGTSWLTSWNRTGSSSARPWQCTWARAWGNSWGDTSACAAAQPTSGGVWRWRWLNERPREDEEPALDAVAAVAERQAQALAKPQAKFDATESLEQLASELDARGLAWDRRYVDLLAVARSWLLAQQAELQGELSAVTSEWARLELIEFERRRRNQNALRVLLLMTLQ